MRALLLVPVVIALAWFARQDVAHSWSGDAGDDG